MNICYKCPNKKPGCTCLEKTVNDIKDIQEKRDKRINNEIQIYISGAKRRSRRFRGESV